MSSQEVDNILGQFCVAFGQGAATARVRGTTVGALMNRYRPNLERLLRKPGGPDAWKREKYHVLDYMRAIGQHAAHLARTEGRMTIDPKDFQTAAKLFEDDSRRKGQAPKGAIPFGEVCAFDK